MYLRVSACICLYLRVSACICVYLCISMCVNMYVCMYVQSPTELWKKKRFNLQAPPVDDRKVTNLFFSIIIVSIIIFFHNSVGDCMSIDSQFECILRGNIEL